jgi:hypothetical protein
MRFVKTNQNIPKLPEIKCVSSSLLLEAGLLEAASVACATVASGAEDRLSAAGWAADDRMLG